MKGTYLKQLVEPVEKFLLAHEVSFVHHTDWLRHFEFWLTEFDLILDSLIWLIRAAKKKQHYLKSQSLITQSAFRL